LVLLGLLIFCVCFCAQANQRADEKRRNNGTPNDASTSNADKNDRTPTRIPEPQATDEDVVLDAVKKMSVEDRKLFLSNVLKTEKYKSSLAVLSVAGNESSSFRKVFQKFSPDCCSICLEEFRNGDEMCASPNQACSHVFHRDCILDWLLTHEICPICRRNYLELNSVCSVHELGSRDLESGDPIDSTILFPDSNGMDGMVTEEPISLRDDPRDHQPVTESSGQSMSGDATISISMSDTNQVAF
jgi:hypothetical protein